MTDMDHVVEEATWKSLLLKDYDPANAYQFARISAPDFQPYKPHPNTWFMTRKKFDEIGGYDERFAGFYGTDADFRDRVLASGTKIVGLKERIVRYPRAVVPDASTTSYLRKQPEDRAGIQRVKAERAYPPLLLPVIATGVSVEKVTYDDAMPEKCLGRGSLSLSLSLCSRLIAII